MSDWIPVLALQALLYVIVDTVGDTELASGWFNFFTTLDLTKYGIDIGRATADTFAAMVLMATALVLVRRSRRTKASNWHLVSVTMLCLSPVAVLNLQRLDAADRSVDWASKSFADARATATYLDQREPNLVLFDVGMPIGPRMIVEYWSPSLETRRSGVTAALGDCPSGTTVVTWDASSPAAEVFGRISVIECD